MKKLKLLYLSLAAFMLPLPLPATGLDGSAQLLCATIDAIECDGLSGECYVGTAETVNLAQFVRIDLKEKKIEAVKQGGKSLSSTIMNHQRENGKLILQGIEDGRGWSLVIVEETGKMSATIAGDQVGFVVFGNCTTL
ncbi:MAG: hypothetical protein ABFR65_06215 [Pseudomonadota bacterium]